MQGLPPGRRQRRAGPRGFCCGGGRVLIPALDADAATAMPDGLADVFADPRFGEVAQWVSNAVSFSAAGVAPKRSEAGQGWMRHDGPVHMLKLHGWLYHRTQAVDEVDEQGNAVANAQYYVLDTFPAPSDRIVRELAHRAMAVLKRTNPLARRLRMMGDVGAEDVRLVVDAPCRGAPEISVVFRTERM